MGMKLINILCSQFVPFLGTAGVKFIQISPELVEVEMQNKKKSMNHIKQVHAMASATAIETATGFVVALNLPDDKLPLLKRIELSYVKRSEGAIRVRSTLTDQQIDSIKNFESGEVNVNFQIQDSKGAEIIIGTTTWAWIPKIKKATA